MSWKYLLLLFCIWYASSIKASPDLCSKKEILANFRHSEKFQAASNYIYSNALGEALPLLKELLLEAENTENRKLKIYTLFLEAELLKKNSSFKKSLENYKVVLAENNFDEGLNFYSLINIGDIHTTVLKEFSEGISFYKKAEDLSRKTSCLEKKALIYSTLGSSFLIHEDYKESEKYYRLELEVHIKNKDHSRTAVTYSNLGNLFFEQYKDKDAEDYFQKALLAIKTNDSTNINVRQQIYENLATVYEETGRHKQALNYLKTSNTLKDSIWNRDKVWELAEIAKEFDVTQKQQEVDLLQAENKVKLAQRNGLLLSAIVLLALLGTGFYFYKEKVKSNKIISAQKEDLDVLNATKDKLFSIVSHDLRSSVQALKTSNSALINMVATKKLDNLNEALQSNSAIANDAYNLLDNLLNWALLQTKQAYFELEQQRLFFIVEHVSHNYKALLQEKNIQFENTVNKSDKVFADQESLKIILRNLIDNAIKFSKENGLIKIYTRNTHPDFCDLIIEDNGLGMKESTRLELQKNSGLLSKKENENIIGTGLGLHLCKSMIAKNKGVFSIESELGKGTKMIVSLAKNLPNG